MHLLVLQFQNAELLQYLTKPALASSLIIFMLLDGRPKKWKNDDLLFISGLVFCLIGDSLLMLDGFFIPGLIAFLIAQCIFALAFFLTNKGKEGYIQRNPWLIIPFALFGIGMVATLEPYAPDFLLPIIAYSFVLLTMAMSALNRFRVVINGSFEFVAIGALCFVISDCILALNRFANEIPFADISIMLTYGLAIFLLTYGMTQFRDES